MENDLIRRSDAIDVCKMALDDDWEPEYAEDRLTEIPAVDAVEVVRCRECVHYEPFRPHDGFCKIDGMLRDNDFFCKCGKRREDGDGDG